MRHPFLISFLISITIGIILGFILKNIFIGIFAGILLQFGLTSYGAFHIRSGFFMQPVNRILSGKMQLVLSFDDGPDTYTSAISDILKKHDIKAHFFLIGNKIEGSEAQVLKLYNDGHILGNHSYCHRGIFYFWSSVKMQDDLLQTNKMLERITGKSVKYFRPPFGVTNPTLANAIKKLGMITVGWSLRTLDTMREPNHQMEAKILRNIKDGDIILFHDTTPDIIYFLDSLIPKLKEKGFNFVIL